MMISMTAYWQQFKECIDSLQPSKDEAYTRVITTAKTLIKIGLTIETLGITEIKQVSNQLSEKAKLFGHEVSYTKDKVYSYYLPKITSTECLIFAVIYYQHLNNYQQVSYEGTISWPFKQMVVDGINEKKISTAIQAKALLQEIRKYCQQQNITIDDSLFLKTNKESVREYTSRISTLFNKPEEPIKQESKEPSQPDPIDDLERSLKILNQRIKGLTTKTDSIAEKLATFSQAKNTYSQLTNDWENKWIITRAFYRFISIFYEVPEIKELKKAEDELIQAEKELNMELPHHSAESYIEKLQKLKKRLTQDHQKIERVILKQKEAQQAKQEDEATKTTFKPHHVNNSEKVTASSEKEEQAPISLVEKPSNSDYYGFFKEHLPSRYTLQAIAVGAVAIAIQNL